MHNVKMPQIFHDNRVINNNENRLDKVTKAAITILAATALVSTYFFCASPIALAAAGTLFAAALAVDVLIKFSLTYNPEDLQMIVYQDPRDVLFKNPSERAYSVFRTNEQLNLSFERECDRQLYARYNPSKPVIVVEQETVQEEKEATPPSTSKVVARRFPQGTAQNTNQALDVLSRSVRRGAERFGQKVRENFTFETLVDLIAIEF